MSEEDSSSDEEPAKKPAAKDSLSSEEDSDDESENEKKPAAKKTASGSESSEEDSDERKNMYMAAYDWRLSFQNTKVRHQTLSRMKSNIELLVSTNDGKKAVPHSMGVLYFLHFMKWVEAPALMGGRDGPDWCAKHIKAVMNIGGPFLSVPKAVAGIFFAEAKEVAVAKY